MKFKLLDRLIYAVILLFVATVAVAAFLVALHVIPQTTIGQMIEIIYSSALNSALLIAISILLLTFVIKLLFANAKPPASPQPQSALIKAGELGAVVMSLEALNAMVQKHCRANTKIRDCESAVLASLGGVNIRLKISVMTDANIPELTQELQETLKKYIEELTGIQVIEISVLIVPLASPSKSTRVE